MAADEKKAAKAAKHAVERLKERPKIIKKHFTLSLNAYLYERMMDAVPRGELSNVIDLLMECFLNELAAESKPRKD